MKEKGVGTYPFLLVQLVFSGFYVSQIDYANHLTTDTCFPPMSPYWNFAIGIIFQLVPKFCG